MTTHLIGNALAIVVAGSLILYAFSLLLGRANAQGEVGQDWRGR